MSRLPDFVILEFSSSFFYWLVPPGFSFFEGASLVDALYFTVVTLSTVGYGDVHPLTAGGKVMTVMLIIAGVGTFFAAVVQGTDLLFERRQEQKRRERLNMVVGLFFAEIGTELLRWFAMADPESRQLKEDFSIGSGWKEGEFERAISCIEVKKFAVDYASLEFAEIKEFLRTHSELLLRMLENPNLSEHEEFTELLRAVFHLRAELIGRTQFKSLPTADLEHIAGDVRRSYAPLAVLWLDHMAYLKGNYPYLYSLAVRTNPFMGVATPILEGKY